MKKPWYYLRFILLLLVLSLPVSTIANPISREQAQQNAVSFLKSKGKFVSSASLRQAPSTMTTTAVEIYYVFNIGNKDGYVIAAGDDCAPAILGYADSGYINVDSMPCNMKAWLEEYAREIQFMQEKGLRSSYQSGLTSGLAPISPLLTTMWGQDYPYNMNCPDFFGYGKCIAGCVATAMAQVMYYHRSNSVNQTTATIPAYTCKRKWDFGGGAQQISVDEIPAGAFIDWDGMIDYYHGYETARQKQAVANLMKYCGASVQMDYSDISSTASFSSVPVALKSYFNYNNGTSLENRNYFSSNDEWNNMIYNELRHSRPIFYGGGNSSSGHAFVCDGYDGDGFFHINWGWDGYCDGYFLLTALDPNGNSSGYNQRQVALINAFPTPQKPVDSPIISFADANVKALCVQYWDFDGDGELSEAEAALVTTLGEVFYGNRDITSFNELRFFTGLTRIGRSAFWCCSGLTSVTIPNSVTTIGEGAFMGCSALASIEIPSSVTEIGRDAFNGTAWFDNQPDGLIYVGQIAYKCKGTMPDGTSIIVKDGTLRIAGFAFEGCRGLTSVTIPNSVTHIGQYAFWNCYSLTSVTIPNSVDLIDVAVFRGCYSLTSVTIPNTVTSIGISAFENCYSLTSMIIPNSVTSIGKGAFRGCYGLTSVIIPNSVTSIGVSAFLGCYSLTSISIPNSVTAIEDNAFQDCTGLTSVTIPNSVTTIGNSAFQGCRGLTSLTIPNSVTAIGTMAFEGCAGLMSIAVNSWNPKYDSRNNCNAIIETARNTLILGCQNTVIPNSVTSIGDLSFYNCTGLTSVIIPNSVTTIGNMAFFNCTGLTNIIIPNSVSSIGYGALYGCTDLTSLVIPNSVTAIGISAFAGCSGLTNVYSYITDLSKVTSENRLFAVNDNYDYSGRTLHVLQGTADDYQADENWYPYFGRIVEDIFMGDVNRDLEVNVADVNAVIGIILGGNGGIDAADVNGDGEINIADINAVINIILGGT